MADSTSPRLRGALDGIPTYKPGQPAPVREGASNFKLSSNENPFPPLSGVVEAATAVLDGTEFEVVLAQRGVLQTGGCPPAAR